MAFTSSFARRRSSAAMITTEVVPSPTSLSCFCARSTKMRPAGCSTARRARIVAPSFEIVTSCESWSKSSSQARKRRPTPMLSTSILSRPRGPKDDLTMFAIVCAATTNSVLSNHERLLEKPQFRTYHSDHGCPGRILCPLRGRHRLLDRAGTYSSLLRGKGIIQRAQSAPASLRQCGAV